jgi:hypothetical protein
MVVGISLAGTIAQLFDWSFLFPRVAASLLYTRGLYPRSLEAEQEHSLLMTSHRGLVGGFRPVECLLSIQVCPQETS